MKRSEINARIRDAKTLFAAHQFRLPPWATWSVADWKANPDTTKWCHVHQMGWDTTDFGAGDFEKRGLLLFCIRNGRQGVHTEVPYAEKIMVVHENQETPLHYHKVKMEDIIVRGGGNLVVELFNNDGEDGLLDTPVSVRTDGVVRQVAAGEPVVLTPGESITIERWVWHRFYGQSGAGTVLAGEVSQVNDDLTDNYFYDAKTRFSVIDEDEDPLHPLWSELPV